MDPARGPDRMGKNDREAQVPRPSTIRGRAGVVLAIASVASFMAALDTLVVTTALTTIRENLGASLAQLEWTVNAFNLTFAVLLMTAAVIGDRVGRRRAFAGGVALFTAASAACALSTSAGALIAARAVQGVGAAAVMTLSFTLVSAAYPPERRGAALGIFFSVTGLAVASGPLIGGAVAESLDWHWIFWLNVPIGLVLVPVALIGMRESRGPAGRLDPLGLALVSAGVLGVVWGLVRGDAAGWGSAEVIGALAAGAALLGLFVGWEWRAPAPMVPLGFFRSRAFAAGNGAIFLVMASLFCAVFFLAQYMQTALGSGPLEAGLRLLPWTGTLFVVAPVAGALVDRWGERPFLIAGPLLQAVGMAWIALLAESGSGYPPMIAPLVVAGVGVSMCFPSAQNSVVSAVPPAAIGIAAGVNSTMRELGGVFGIAAAVAVFAAVGGDGTPAGFADGVAGALWLSTGLSVLAGLAGAALPGRRPAQVPPVPATSVASASSAGT